MVLPISSKDCIPRDNISVGHLVEELAGSFEPARTAQHTDTEVVVEYLSGGERVDTEWTNHGRRERLERVEESLDFREGCHE